MRARFIVVDEKTGEVKNAYIVECASLWPPTGVNVSLADTVCEYQVGDYVDPARLERIAKSKENNNGGNN